MPSGSTVFVDTQVREDRTWTLGGDTGDVAGDLKDRFSLNDRDARMVAAAQQQGCLWLLTEDLQHGQQINSVQILNPFIAGPDVLDTTPP